MESRQRVTLFSQEDAEAMTLRERAGLVSRGKYDSRASSYVMRPSQTVYGRESGGDDLYFDGSSSYVSVGGASVAEMSANSATAAGNAAAAAAASAAAVMRRLSVSPDVNATFEDMFETDWEGYIWKQGHVVRSWRYRYAVLSGTTFSCTYRAGCAGRITAH